MEQNSESPIISSEDHSKHPQFVRWALMIGIVVVLNIFFNVVLALAYPAPEYNDYCPQVTRDATDAVACDAQGGVWHDYTATEKPVPVVPGESQATGYCDRDAKCQAPYEVARNDHALYAFVIMTVLGVAAILTGLVPLGSSIVSTGISYGGVVALIIGSMQYWGTAGNWIRLGIISVGLVALIVIGLRRFRD